MDHPQLTGSALVAPDDREAPRVAGPRDVGAFPPVCALLALVVGVAAIEPAVAVAKLPVGRELRLLDLDLPTGTVGGGAVLPTTCVEDLLVGVGVHHVEVVPEHEDDRLAVRGDAGPGRVVIGLLEVRELAQRLRADVELEVKDLLIGTLAPLVPFLLLVLLLLLFLSLDFLPFFVLR